MIWGFDWWFWLIDWWVWLMKSWLKEWMNDWVWMMVAVCVGGTCVWWVYDDDGCSCWVCAFDGEMMMNDRMRMMKRAIYICDIYRGIGYTLALTWPTRRMYCIVKYCEVLWSLWILWMNCMDLWRPEWRGSIGGPNPCGFCGLWVGFCEIVRIGVPNGVPNWGYCTVSG